MDTDEFTKIRKRFQRCLDYESENREKALEDIRFRDGDQWPESVRRERESDKRPCLTFNRLEGFIDQVVGDSRQNKIAIKIRPEDDAPHGVIYENLITQIQYKSKADIAYQTAFDHACGHGFGFIRVNTKYKSGSFDQECEIRRITNPFTIYFDSDAKEFTKWDAKYCFVSIYLDKDEFKKKYPNMAWEPVEGSGERYEDWFGDKVRVAEYFERKPIKKTLVLLSTGEVVEKTKDIPKDLILNERVDKTYKVTRRLISGREDLEPVVDVPCQFLPIVPVYGKELHIEGKTIYRGVIRFAKDAQQSYNFHRTASAESVALAPRSPWLATAEQVEGFEAIWQTANTKNHSFLPYNNVPGSPIPQRIQGGAIPTGAVNEAAMAAEDLKATTGIYDASLGSRSNETSGRAILARQREGDTATFTYHDNLSIAIEQVGRILVDMIPNVYDGARNIRIRENDQEQIVPINAPVPGGMINDLKQGEYTVAVSTGPSYATQRIEALDALMQLVQVSPELRSGAMDKVLENMDFKGAEEIAQRLKAMLPPQILNPGQPQEPSPEQQADMAKSEATIAKAEADKVQAQADMLQATGDVNQLKEMIEAMVDQGIAEALTELQA